MSCFDILVLNEDEMDDNGSSQQNKSMCVRKEGGGVVIDVIHVFIKNMMVPWS